jgi:CDGSH-type Zn-finger protein/uncharacterized Fe-S cluster protein YjdI
MSPDAEGKRGGTGNYIGKSVSVRYEARRCIHAAECVRGAPQVFDPDAQPWITPDNGTVEELTNIVARCPTGALTLFAPDGARLEPPPARNVASVQPRGPIYMRARVTFPGGEHASLVEYTRVALCRCGASANKPFCDGSHTRVGFDDPGACANAPVSIEQPAIGLVKVTPKPNGPLMIEGTVEFQAADGGRFVTDKVWLCRCGGSANKPFCDGTHKRNGFTA